MRVDECFQIKLDEIDLKSVPARIILRAEYSKKRKQRFQCKSISHGGYGQEDATIEKAVRDRMNAIRDMYAEKTEDEKDGEIRTLTEMVLIANQEANEYKSNYSEFWGEQVDTAIHWIIIQQDPEIHH